ncbi:hypothetical protein [Fodinicola acaciae]|uniref:hypothetical protein n=1 Tax=Fodinicola acaciae TaxID=2681555 RepID=UPI0013D667DB|nr:hypothetical protein [Fodinicola acaciae]
MIEWGTLGVVVLTSLVAGVVIVTLFALGIVSLSKAPPLRARNDGKAEDGRPGWYVPAVACFLACAAAIVYGVVVMLSKG